MQLSLFSKNLTKTTFCYVISGNLKNNIYRIKCNIYVRCISYIKALKSFVIEQLYVIKKSIEDFKGQENIPNSNSSVLIQSLKEELHYLQNENLAKTSIIKSLTENYCFPANINSVLFQQNLHREKVQDDKSSPNKSSGSSKTHGKCIILNEIKSQANQKKQSKSKVR